MNLTDPSFFSTEDTFHLNSSLFIAQLNMRNENLETTTDMFMPVETSTSTYGRSSGLSVYSFGVLILFLWVCLICYLAGHASDGRPSDDPKKTRPVIDKINHEKCDLESVATSANLFDSRFSFSDMSDCSTSLNCYMDAQSRHASVANAYTTVVLNGRGFDAR